MEKWLIQIVMPRRVGIGPFDHIVKHSLREGQEWRISLLVPIFKNKDDVPWDKAYDSSHRGKSC